MTADTPRTDRSDPSELAAPRGGGPGRRRIDRRRFLRDATAVGVGALTVAGMPPAVRAAIPAGAGNFHPLPQAVRIADTRAPDRYPVAAVGPDRVRVAVAGTNGVPSGASAAVLTVSAVNGGEPNYVTVFPAGSADVPLVSSLNLAPGDVAANLVTVKIGDGGAVDVARPRACHVIVDVVGWYEPVVEAVADGRFVPLATAARVLDTRPGQALSSSYRVVDLAGVVPADASAVMVNLTATASTGPGFFTAVPRSVADEPTTSNLNVSRAGETRAAAAVVAVDVSGGRPRFEVFTKTAAKLIVDVVGWFTGERSPVSSDGLFVPVDPVRILDTRRPDGTGRLWPGWVVEAPIPGPAATQASAIVANLTLVGARSAGYLTMSPARREIPGTSNVNCSFPGAVVPNHAVSAITDRYGVQVLSSHGAHVLIDFAGWYTGVPAAPLFSPHVNPPPPPIGPPWVLRVPRIGVTSTVLDGDPDRVTDAGNTWHWTGTGDVGHDAHVGLFAHRTTHGGAFRNIHHLQVGDAFTLSTTDRREYSYRVVRRDLTDSRTANILDATRFHPGPTVSLIACTVGYDSSKANYPDVWAPTSTRYRIVVTAEQVGWREV